MKSHGFIDGQFGFIVKKNLGTSLFPNFIAGEFTNTFSHNAIANIAIKMVSKILLFANKICLWII
jgi:hypothetical protein